MRNDSRSITRRNGPGDVGTEETALSHPDGLRLPPTGPLGRRRRSQVNSHWPLQTRAFAVTL